MKLKPFKRVPAVIAFGVIALVCVLRLTQPNLVERFERITYDMRAREAIRFPSPTATNLGFVFIDEDSVRTVWNGSLGYRFGLHWPRQVFGRLVEELSAQHARAVAFDVLFGELRPDHAPVQMADGTLVESDVFFAEQMRRASNVIIAVTKEVFPPVLFLTNALAAADITTEKDNPDGILRRVQMLRPYTNWHEIFRQAESEYGLDLARARFEPGRLRIPSTETGEISVPLDAEGNFDLTDFIGQKIPPGMARKAKPFTIRKVWHMGVVLAACQLDLDLSKADVDLREGRILLRGPGVERIIPVDREGYSYVNWSLPVNSPFLTQEPIQSLLRQHRARLEGKTAGLTNRWAGKLVVVGSSALVGNNLTDRGATPLARDTLLISKHWNVANSILTGQFVRRSPLGLDLAIIALMGGLSGFLSWRLHAPPAAGAVLLTALGYLALSTAVYIRSRYWLPIILPVGGALLMSYVCMVTWRAVFEEAERRRMKSIFGTVVSEKIINELLGLTNLSLGGARREITVLFADIRGFTEFTDTGQEHAADFVRSHGLKGESAEACFNEQAREALDTVNVYLGLVADIVIKHDATLDKFIGDCVMAFWGAPTAHPHHASACVRAAIEAQRAIENLNAWRAAENKRRELENLTRSSAGLELRPSLPLLMLGTGINTGMATVGLMGSEAKMRNYTVFGREVNLASRLEGLSGHGRIFISEATYRQLQQEAPDLAATCVAQPPQRIKGISTPVNVFEVPWRQPAAQDASPGTAPG